MSCRRAEEIDLLEFVADGASDGGGFAAFREHYPTCPECSAEVHAFTELHLALAADGGHPAAATLARFEAGRLREAERRAVESHLAACPSCRDEVAAVRGSSLPELEPARPVGTPGGLVGLLERLRALVMHPGFAYAIVLLLLVYPALSGRVPPADLDLRDEKRETPETEEPSALAQAPSRALDEIVQAPLLEEGAVAGAGPAGKRAAADERADLPAPPTGAASGAEPKPRRKQRGLADAPDASAEAALRANLNAEVDEASKLASQARALARSSVPGEAPRAYARAREADAPLPLSMNLSMPGPRIEGRTLRVPIAPGVLEVELRVRTPEGDRELRARFRALEGAEASVELPDSWLGERVLVEVWLPGASAPAARFGVDPR